MISESFENLSTVHTIVNRHYYLENEGRVYGIVHELSFMEKCSYHPSSKKPLYKKLETTTEKKMYKMQRSTNLREHSSSQYSSTKTLSFMAQGASEESEGFLEPE